jgi:hypothetical protein
MLYSDHARRRLHALYQNGTATLGTVIGVSRRTTGRVTLAEVSYEYEAEGVGHRGTLYTDSPAGRTVEVDDPTVLVIHDPKEPARHLAVLSSSGG